jgi:hypothetical protein
MEALGGEAARTHNVIVNLNVHVAIVNDVVGASKVVGIGIVDYLSRVLRLALQQSIQKGKILVIIRSL